MDTTELQELKCPKCGGHMVHGYVTGAGTGLIWTEDKKTKTLFAGKRLRLKMDWWNAPNVEAVRCQNCKIGVFRYGY